MLCKACRQKAGLARSAVTEQRSTIDLLIAMKIDPTPTLKPALGFENSSQYEALQRLIAKADPK